MRFEKSASCAAAAGLALLLAACGESAAPEEPALTEAALVDAWTTTQTAPLIGTLQITMDISADHSMTVTVRKRVQDSSGDSIFVPVQVEAMTWSLSGGQVTSTKTECRYANAQTGVLEVAACSVPISRKYDVVVKGNSLTTVEGEMIYTFTRE